MSARTAGRRMQPGEYASCFCGAILDLDFAALVFGPDDARGSHGDDRRSGGIAILGLQRSLETPELLRVDGGSF